MQLTSLLSTAAGLAVATNAFLLPPEVSEHDNDVISALPVPHESVESTPIQKLDSQSLALSCPGCPMRVAHHGLDGEAAFTTKIPSHLELDFSIETSGGRDHLILNGFELYPQADPFRNTLSAPLVPEMKRHKNRPQAAVGRPTHIEPLGFGLRTSHIETSPDDALELMQIDVQVIEVGNAFVNGIQNVQVHLVKTPTDKLMIANIEATDSETIQDTPMADQEECTTMLCKWRAEFMERLTRMRQAHCGGHRESHHPQHHGGHMYSGHMSSPPDMLGEENTHSWGQLFKNIGSHILLPIAIGILAGVTASIFGMMIGTVLVFLWRNVTGRGGSSRRRRGHSHKAASTERAQPAEKAGLMAHQESEAPPSYVEEGLIDMDTKHESETGS